MVVEVVYTVIENNVIEGHIEMAIVIYPFFDNGFSWTDYRDA
jgi:hypothetical protein